MHPLQALLIYLGAIFVGGALMAPWLYGVAQWAGEHVRALHGLAAEPFQRYLTRTLLVIALAGLWPFAHCLGARSWNDVGLAKPAGHWRKLAGGFLLGFVSLAVVAAVTLLTGVRELDTSRTTGAFVEHLLSAGLAAIVVAPLEEIVFRGAVFGALRKAARWTTALVVSSAVYALVHFFEKSEPLAAVTWTAGFELLPKMARGFVDWHAVVPGFFNLTLAGVILGLAYQRSGNLYLSIGLHAGWIFWLKSFGFLTNPIYPAREWFWGTRKLIDGWLALIILGGTLLWLLRFCPKASGERPD